MKNVTFEIVKSTVSADNSTMPQMKITVDDSDSDRKRIGYLTPFRGYRFRVSGDMNGGGDYGSSEVVGLARILLADYGTAEDKMGTWGYQTNVPIFNTGVYMLEALAEIAIVKFTDGERGLKERITLTKFVELCSAYIANKVGSNFIVSSLLSPVDDNYTNYCDE